MLFLNRRGYANLMLCKDCGNSVQCSNCNISLTLHQGREELVCHYCGFNIKSAALCSHCRSPNLVSLGFGTERIEQELKKILPQAVIARLDRDTAVNRKSYLKILKEVSQQKIDVLVGTQMITKGHHFPNVTLVGVVWADAGLGIPDYKSGERTFQLLTQVFGRAGRGEKSGRVLVQTHRPEHYSISFSQSHNYRKLFDQEIKLRQSLRYPPFSRLVNIRLEASDENLVRESALRLATLARQKSKKHFVEVLGPAPAPLSRLRGKFRWQLLLKGGNLKALHDLTAGLLKINLGLGTKNAVKLTVDVDPENML